MVQAAAERITDYLLDQVGEELRTVVIVQPYDYEIHHLNPELKRQYSEDTYAEVVDSFRLDKPKFSPGIDGTPVGERRAIVHYHANAFVLQFPFSSSETILISVTRDVGRDLLGFIESCRELIQDN